MATSSSTAPSDRSSAFWECIGREYHQETQSYVYLFQARVKYDYWPSEKKTTKQHSSTPKTFDAAVKKSRKWTFSVRKIRAAQKKWLEIYPAINPESTEVNYLNPRTLRGEDRALIPLEAITRGLREASNPETLKKIAKHKRSRFQYLDGYDDYVYQLKKRSFSHRQTRASALKSYRR